MNPPLDFDQWLASKETPAAPEASALRLRIGPPADAGRPSASVALVGDLAFIHHAGEALARGEDPIAPVGGLLKADLAVANLETPLVGDEPLDPSRGVLKSDAGAGAPLCARWFDGFNLANNHSLDCGAAGLARTLDCLKQHQRSGFGAGENLAAAARPWIVERNGLRIGMIGFSQPELDGAASDRAGVNPLRVAAVLEQVRALVAQVDVPIVHLHEGYEFYEHPRPAFVALCHAVIDAGAAVVCGHHPHVPQGFELRPRPSGATPGLILYSMGNFLFDMPYHREHIWTTAGMIVTLTLSAAGVHALQVRFARLTEAGVLRPFTDAENRDGFAHLQRLSRELPDAPLVARAAVDAVDEVMSVILDAVYRLGERGDRAAFEHFLRQTRRDPYLKAFSDYALHHAAGAPLRVGDVMEHL